MSQNTGAGETVGCGWRNTCQNQLKLLGASVTVAQCPQLLFDLVVEILATMVRENENITGVKCTALETKLLLFADDIVLFLQSPEESLRAVHELLNKYSMDSGFMFNEQKSTILGLN